MENVSSSQFYPIPMDKIKEKVNKKNNRKRNNHSVLEGRKNIKEIVNEFGENITRVDGNIPVDLPVNNKDRFLFISYDQSILTHGIHKYPAKFFPELPRWLIERYSKENALVLDPFSGSGTTNVEALLLKRNSMGIDVDPFSRFLSKVKVTPLDEKELRKFQHQLLKKILEYQPSKVSNKDIPDFPYRDNWFNKEITLELSYLKKIINSLNCNDDIKDFFKICFSSIIRSVSNADNNCTRTVIRKVLNKQVYPADALKKFTEAILTSIPKVIDFSSIIPDHIEVDFPKNMDARNILFEENTFDLALTSPPYANAVDYPRTHQLELYWLGFASGSLTPLKKMHVGTESVTSKYYNDLHKIDVQIADEVITKIFKKDKRRAYIAYKFLKDMQTNIKEVHRVLKKNGRYILVIGNNRIRGELFESWKYLMIIAKEIGFEVENYFASEIIKHFIKVPREQRIDTDWILVLKK